MSRCNAHLARQRCVPPAPARTPDRQRVYPDRSYRVPLYPLTPLALVGTAALLVGTSVYDPRLPVPNRALCIPSRGRVPAVGQDADTQLREEFFRALAIGGATKCDRRHTRGAATL